MLCACYRYRMKLLEYIQEEKTREVKKAVSQYVAMSQFEKSGDEKTENAT